MTPEQFADQAGLTFSDPGLVRRALTHRSYVNEHPSALEDNERLEFLGDAALDFVSGAWLYNRFPEMDEGQLTRLRSALVRTEQLAAFAGQIQLGEAIRLGKGEDLNGGRERPTLLCAAFEAVVGALFLDRGIEAVQEFMESRFQEAVKIILADDALIDARSLLQIWAQAERSQTPAYHVVETSGPDHSREFLVEVKLNRELLGRGRGNSKQEASQAAAQDALSGIDWKQYAFE